MQYVLCNNRLSVFHADRRRKPWKAVLSDPVQRVAAIDAAMYAVLSMSLYTTQAFTSWTRVGRDCGMVLACACRGSHAWSCSQRAPARASAFSCLRCCSRALCWWSALSRLTYATPLPSCRPAFPLACALVERSSVLPWYALLGAVPSMGRVGLVRDGCI